jgi:hypothetical protein
VTIVRPTWWPGHESASPEAAGIQRLREQRARLRAEGAAAHRLEESLISLAALLGTPVRSHSGAELGKLSDVVVHWTETTAYPPVTAIVVRVARRQVVLAATTIDATAPYELRLHSRSAYVRSAERRGAEVALAHDVLDRQIVAADWVDVLRPADVYLASVRGRLELVGVELGVSALVRRLGPKRLRRRIRPQCVIDWSTVRSFAPVHGEAANARGRRSDLAGRTGTALQLDVPVAELHGAAATDIESALRAARDDPHAGSR